MIGLKYLCFSKEIRSNLIAKELGVSPGNFADWLSKRRSIPDKYLNLLSNKFNVSPEYLVSEIELQEVTTKDVSDIYLSTQALMQEISIRNGSFDAYSGKYDLNDFESLLCARYINGEIIYSDLLALIRQYHLSIPIFLEDNKQREFLDNNEMGSCTYSHWHKDEPDTYSILSDEFKFENIFADLSGEEIIEQKKLFIEEGQIVITQQYGEDDVHTAVYREQILIGKYYFRSMFDGQNTKKFDWHIFTETIKKLFEFENLDQKQCKRMCKAYKKAVIAHLENLAEQQRKWKQKREQEEQRKKQEQQKQYSNYQKSNYQNSDWYKTIGSSTTTSYTDKQKDVMKKMVKYACMKMHPDAGGKEEDMKVLVGLKELWHI
jgi:transcriptional regulator with XRE-family HTH domain